MKKNTIFPGIVLCVVLFSLFVMIGCFFFTDNDKTQKVTKLVRPEGYVAKEYEITAVCEGESKVVTAIVEPKAPTKEELTKLFDEAYKMALTQVKGENETLNYVSKKLNLITSLEEYNMNISWFFSDYDVIDNFGEIYPLDDMCKVEAEVELYYRGKLSDGVDNSKSYSFFIEVAPKEHSFLNDIEKVIEAENKSSIENTYLILPSKYGNKKITFFQNKKNDYNLVFILLPVVIVLLFLSQKSRQKEKLDKKKESMVREYADIVTKLSLLSMAGMTPYNALAKIANSNTGEAYEELKRMIAQIESGSFAIKEYALMGKRFGLQCYSRLGSLLGQNQTKGNEFFCQMLKEEAYEALQERKNRARKAGERAGTLLLIPMVIMLGIVMAIIMIPAFMSF